MEPYRIEGEPAIAFAGICPGGPFPGYPSDNSDAVQDLTSVSTQIQWPAGGRLAKPSRKPHCGRGFRYGKIETPRPIGEKPCKHSTRAP